MLRVPMSWSFKRRKEREKFQKQKYMLHVYCLCVYHMYVYTCIHVCMYFTCSIKLSS